ncbi:hypothetical protein Hdeb2414_s0032g00715961 [Helianthus debilis subsp. tardiflorus]
MSDETTQALICSICHEDLNPIVEDLQAISVCGHVFHELWLTLLTSTISYYIICHHVYYLQFWVS